ncbi:hypothetical protein NDU88_006223 [Pleurodeles waltl]|uniref:Uncharacterized protein n=1 Tax=Pleurodeles waltl TaxID=8319 RepID=A0AAV7WCZ3_PLEWA|nr:hypothetical protein NDU88_006223 [Pleurodeles waltl]
MDFPRLSPPHVYAGRWSAPGSPKEFGGKSPPGAPKVRRERESVNSGELGWLQWVTGKKTEECQGPPSVESSSSITNAMLKAKDSEQELNT